MTVYTVTSTTHLGTVLSNRYYTADKAEAERGRRVIAGDTDVHLDIATVYHNNSEIYAAPDAARPGLKGAMAHA